MKAIGFAYGQLWGIRYKHFSIVVCAPDYETAREAFVIWISKCHRYENIIVSQNIRMRRTKTVGERPLIWAQVDVTV